MIKRQVEGQDGQTPDVVTTHTHDMAWECLYTHTQNIFQMGQNSQFHVMFIFNSFEKVKLL